MTVAHPDFHRPDSLDQAVIIAAGGGVTLAAGYTDLFAATQAQTLPGPVLDLTGIAGLRGISRGATAWRFGATTLWSDVTNADLPPAFDGLKQAAAEVGSTQIQNAGTMGGNLCNASPAADGIPPLMTLNASVELTSRTGTRHLDLADFVTGPGQTALLPGEILTAIHVPEPSGHGAFVKLGARKHLVISIAMVAARITLAQGRIIDAALSVGACGPTARRLTGQEAALIGLGGDTAIAAITPDLVAAPLTPIDDLRADAPYRLTSATELTRRLVASLLRGGGGQPGGTAP